MKNVFVYVLRCPTTNEIRYVGQTVNTTKRLEGHLSCKTQKEKGKWIKSLLEEGKKPILEVVDKGNKKRMSAKEMSLINELRKKGANLFNINDGIRKTDNGQYIPRENPKVSVRLEFTESELRRIKKKADKCRQPRKLYMESVVVRSVTGEGLE